MRVNAGAGDQQGDYRMQGTATPTPLKSRLDRIRARRDNPTPRIVQLYPSEPTRLSPFVRMARRGELRPKAFCGGAFVPRGEGDAA